MCLYVTKNFYELLLNIVQMITSLGNISILAIAVKQEIAISNHVGNVGK